MQLMLKLERKGQNMELLEKVLDDNNLKLAYKQVYQNKGACGIDKVTVEELEDYMAENMTRIADEIRKRKYTPSPVKRVYIPKDNGDKRGLGIPTVIDRVIQQAIVQILSPIYEEQFSNSSYGFRPNRSCEMAVVKLLELFNDGYTWIVDIDLEKFFDRVCHDKLISIIMKTIHDGELVSLIRKYLVAGVMENGIVHKISEGTPQGGNLSPLLSNIMLNELDRELEKRGLNFTRYADDCIIVVKSEKAANRVMKSITEYIEKKLGLKVNVTKSKVAKPKDIKYLGFGFYTNAKGIIRPKPHIKSIQKFQRKLKQLTKRNWSISLDERIKRINYVTRGWINYFKIADAKGFLEEVGMKLRHRIRTIIWKQWKIPKTRYRALVKLGISEEQAKIVASTRRGYFWVASTIVIHIAISNKRLKQRGLVFPLDHYAQVHI